LLRWKGTEYVLQNNTSEKRAQRFEAQAHIM